MELSVLERLLLLNVLPKEGDIISVRIIHKLRQDLSFSEDELALLNFTKTGDGGLTWNTDTPVVRTVQIGPKAQTLIADALVVFNNQKKLTIDYIDIYDRFVANEAQ